MYNTCLTPNVVTQMYIFQGLKIIFHGIRWNMLETLDIINGNAGQCPGYTGQCPWKRWKTLESLDSEYFSCSCGL
jgi:hypothetical protein